MDPVARSRAVLQSASAVAQRRMAEHNQRAAAAAAAQEARAEEQRQVAAQRASEDARAAASQAEAADRAAAVAGAQEAEASALVRGLSTRMQQAERQLQQMQGQHSAAQDRLRSVVEYTGQLLAQVQETRGIWGRAPVGKQDALMQGLQHVLQLMDSVQHASPPSVPSAPPAALQAKHIKQAKRASEAADSSAGQGAATPPKATKHGTKHAQHHGASPAGSSAGDAAREQAFNRGAWSGLFLSSAVPQQEQIGAQQPARGSPTRPDTSARGVQYSSPPASAQRRTDPPPPAAATPPLGARRFHRPGEVALPPSSAVASLLSPESSAYAELAAIDERLATIGARVQRVQRSNLVKGLKLRKGGARSPSRQEQRPTSAGVQRGAGRVEGQMGSM